FRARSAVRQSDSASWWPSPSSACRRGLCSLARTSANRHPAVVREARGGQNREFGGFSRPDERGRGEEERLRSFARCFRGPPAGCPPPEAVSRDADGRAGESTQDRRPLCRNARAFSVAAHPLGGTTW